VCERIGKENEVTISKIKFLGRPKPEKAYGSIVIYLPNEQEAERLIEDTTMNFGDEGAYIRRYIPISLSERCYNCQRFTGYRAERCPDKVPTCGHCAQQGHTHDKCTQGSAKCANCEGAHSSNDRECPTYKDTLERLRSSIWV
jgi:hypothetical protein